MTKTPVEVIDARAVSEAIENGEGIGNWLPCTGCHELNEGHPTGRYSNTLKCHLGLGCTECGGLGAIWDTTDYADMVSCLVRGLDASAPTEARAATAAAYEKAAQAVAEWTPEAWGDCTSPEDAADEIRALATEDATAAIAAIVKQAVDAETRACARISTRGDDRAAILARLGQRKEGV